MFRVETPARDGVPAATHMVLAIGVGHAGAMASLGQIIKLKGDERITSLPVSDELVEFMDLHDGEAHFWRR